MKKEHSKRPTAWIISTAVLGFLLLATIGAGAFMISGLRNDVTANQTKVDTLTDQVSEKDTATQALQGKYDSLESDYRKLQTANAQASSTPTSSASRCESKYLYSSNKYVTTCN